MLYATINKEQVFLFESIKINQYKQVLQQFYFQSCQFSPEKKKDPIHAITVGEHSHSLYNV